ncbi:hypothetical protein D3C78_1370840 [compost metagenome]
MGQQLDAQHGRADIGLGHEMAAERLHHDVAAAGIEPHAAAAFGHGQPQQAQLGKCRPVRRAVAPGGSERLLPGLEIVGARKIALHRFGQHALAFIEIVLHMRMFHRPSASLEMMFFWTSSVPP